MFTGFPKCKLKILRYNSQNLNKSQKLRKLWFLKGTSQLCISHKKIRSLLIGKRFRGHIHQLRNKKITFFFCHFAKLKIIFENFVVHKIKQAKSDLPGHRYIFPRSAGVLLFWACWKLHEDCGKRIFFVAATDDHGT